MAAVSRRWRFFSLLILGAAILFLTPAIAQTGGQTTVSVTAVQLSFTVSPGSVNFGPVGLGGFATTQTNPPAGPAVPGQTETVTNNSSVGVVLHGQYVALAQGTYGADCDGNQTTAEWSPVWQSPGPEQFSLGAGNVNNDGSIATLDPLGFPTWLNYQSQSVIPPGATSPLDFTIWMPSDHGADERMHHSEPRHRYGGPLGEARIPAHDTHRHVTTREL